jgi:hypothetical protein
LPVVTAVPEGLEKEIRKLRNQLKYMGTINPNAPQEYDELKARHAFLTEQAADAHRAIESLHKAIGELDAIMRDKFGETFRAINKEFARFFTLLFEGGTARLELTQPDDVTQTGIDIIARPPGKRAAHLAILSGGERSLTATALLFAILKVSPTPFCVLDEVDAALDEANVGRFRDALKSLSAETQFIVITHNRTTMESADTVYGITMSEDGVSQAISLRLNGNGKGPEEKKVESKAVPVELQEPEQMQGHPSSESERGNAVKPHDRVEVAGDFQRIEPERPSPDGGENQGEIEREHNRLEEAITDQNEEHGGEAAERDTSERETE